MSNATSNDRSLTELTRLLDESDTAWFTTRGADGHFHSRPMALKHNDIRNGLWFAARREGGMIHEIEANADCCVATSRGATYVSISGTARVIADQELIASLWAESWRRWFPRGPADSNLALIRVEPEHAEYVRSSDSGLRVLFSKAKHLLGGKQDSANTPGKQEVDFNQGDVQASPLG